MTNPERREKKKQILKVLLHGYHEEDCSYGKTDRDEGDFCTCNRKENIETALSALEALMPEVMSEEEIVEVLSSPRYAHYELTSVIKESIAKALTIAKPQISECVHNFDHTHRDHDNMTTAKLAEHLGIELWKVMEIARWGQTKAKPVMTKEEVELILEEMGIIEIKYQKSPQAEVEYYTIKDLASKLIGRG